MSLAYIAFDETEILQESLQLKILKKKIGNAQDIAKLAAPKTAQVLYNAVRVGPRLILRSAFELLRANMATRVISVVMLLAIDKFSLIKGRISVKQFAINVVLALMLLVGGTAGWILGSHVLGLVIENLVLGILAGIVGAGILSALLSMIVNKIIHIFIQDDTEDMLDIYNASFAAIAAQHRLNIIEIEAAKADIAMSQQMIKDIFAEEDRAAFAHASLEPYVLSTVAGRGTTP